MTLTLKTHSMPGTPLALTYTNTASSLRELLWHVRCDREDGHERIEAWRDNQLLAFWEYEIDAECGGYVFHRISR